MCLGIRLKSMGPAIKHIMALHLACCVTLDKILNLSGHVSFSINNSQHVSWIFYVSAVLKPFHVESDFNSQ